MDAGPAVADGRRTGRGRCRGSVEPLPSSFAAWLAARGGYEPRMPMIGWSMRLCGYIPLERASKTSIARFPPASPPKGKGRFRILMP